MAENKPSKFPGVLLMGIIGISSIWVSSRMMSIVEAVQQMGVVGWAVTIGAAGILIASKRLRKLIKYTLNGIANKVGSVFWTEEDPMTVLKKYVTSLEKNYQELSNNISKLRTQIAKIRDIMKQNNKEIEKSTRLIEEAKRQGREEVVAVNYNQIGRLTKLNEKYALMAGRMDNLNSVLLKMHSYASYKLNDTKNEIRMKEQEFAAITSGYSAMKNAKSILDGNYEQNEAYAAATENLYKDLHTKIAEMDSFMQLSSPLFDDMELQKAIYQIDGENTYDKIMKEGRAILDQMDYSQMDASYLPNHEKMSR